MNTSTGTPAPRSATDCSLLVMSTRAAPAAGRNGSSSRRVGGVVEHQQAALPVGLQPVPHRPARRRRVPGPSSRPSAAATSARPASSTAVVFGVDPGHQPPALIDPGPRVRRRQLRLAHPPHPGHRMHHPHPRPPAAGASSAASRSARGWNPSRLLRDFPHHDRRARTAAAPAAGAPCLGQLPQRALHQLPQRGRARKRPRDQPAIPDPAAERILPRPELAVDQLRQRDAHIVGVGIQHEHQPVQARLRRGARTPARYTTPPACPAPGSRTGCPAPPRTRRTRAPGPRTARAGA